MTPDEHKELKTLRDEVTKLYIRVMEFEEKRMDLIKGGDADEIIKACLSRWGVSLHELRAKVRETEFVRRRMLLGYLLVNHSSLNRKQIAHVMGYKNHSSLNHIIYTMQSDLFYKYPDMRKEYKELLLLLKIN